MEKQWELGEGFEKRSFGNEAISFGEDCSGTLRHGRAGTGLAMAEKFRERHWQRISKLGSAMALSCDGLRRQREHRCDTQRLSKAKQRNCEDDRGDG